MATLTPVDLEFLAENKVALRFQHTRYHDYYRRTGEIRGDAYALGYQGSWGNDPLKFQGKLKQLIDKVFSAYVALSDNGGNFILFKNVEGADNPPEEKEEQNILASVGGGTIFNAKQSLGEIPVSPDTLSLEIGKNSREIVNIEEISEILTERIVKQIQKARRFNPVPPKTVSPDKTSNDKKAAEKQAAERKAAAERLALAERKAVADREAAAERAEAAEKKAAAERQAIAERKAVAEREAAAEKLALEKQAAERKAAAERQAIAERKAVADREAAAEKLALEKQAAERRENERREAEKRAQEKIAADQREKEQKEAERHQAERRAIEKLSEERRDNEKRALEKQAAERREAERKALEEQVAKRRAIEKQAEEQRNAERKALEAQAADRREKEKREAEHREQERREAEKLAIEKLQAEQREAQEREAKREEQERLEALEKQAEAEREARVEKENAAPNPSQPMPSNEEMTARFPGGVEPTRELLSHHLSVGGKKFGFDGQYLFIVAPQDPEAPDARKFFHELTVLEESKAIGWRFKGDKVIVGYANRDKIKKHFVS